MSIQLAWMCPDKESNDDARFSVAGAPLPKEVGLLGEGHSVKELLRLLRSSVPSQRALGSSTLTKVLQRNGNAVAQVHCI